MSSIILQGRRSHRWRALSLLTRTTLSVLARRLVGRPWVRGWTVPFEIGTLFYRAHFDHAFACGDIREARAYFDSLVSVADRHPAADLRPTGPGEPRGHWCTPQRSGGDAARPVTVLYLHGGGYAFHAAVSVHFSRMLAAELGTTVLAVDYRLTPEHPHPAQLQDALAAYRFLLDRGHEPSRLVVLGDSAGGHLALMLLARLRAAGWPQPALGIGLSPWTDIGRRGASQFGHDRYDMVQGYQTLQYARWLRGGTGLSDEALSPIAQDFRGCAPLYLQAGGLEILVDMIRDFARVAHEQGTRVRLDIWPAMTHEFHAYGETLPESRQAFVRLREAIAWATAAPGAVPDFGPSAQTELDGWTVRPPVAA